MASPQENEKIIFLAENDSKVDKGFNKAIKLPEHCLNNMLRHTNKQRKTYERYSN